MTRADVLQDALWQWAVPSLVLVIGLSEAFSNTTGASRIFEIGVVLALALPLVVRARAPIIVPKRSAKAEVRRCETLQYLRGGFVHNGV